MSKPVEYYQALVDEGPLTGQEIKKLVDIETEDLELTLTGVRMERRETVGRWKGCCEALDRHCGRLKRKIVQLEDQIKQYEEANKEGGL
jgi:hypothetical protein